MLNNRLDVFLLLHHGLVQLPLYHFIINTKVILPVCVFDLLFQAFLRIRKFLAEVLVLFPNLLRGLLNELVLPLDLGI